MGDAVAPGAVFVLAALAAVAPGCGTRAAPPPSVSITPAPPAAPSVPAPRPPPPDGGLDDPEGWEIALADARDACAPVPVPSPCFALRLEDRTAYEIVFHDPPSGPLPMPRVRAVVDGEELAGKVGPGVPRPTSGWPSKVVARPIPPGRHTVDLELTFTGEDGKSLTARRSIPVEARAGRGVLVRAEVEAQPSGSPEAMRLTAASRDAERLALPDLARATLDRMAAIAEEVRALLAEKRRERDVVWVLCLNDKLSQIHVALRSAGERRLQLLDAISAGNAEETAHQRTILWVLRLRGEQLLMEARQCV